MSLAHTPDFSPYQKDVLFLLIGANPLPNYVAALLLAQESGAVYLLHSSATDKIAKRLEGQIKEKRPGVSIVPREIDGADSQIIASQILKIIKDDNLTGKQVGLNYTGGTKPMSVHTYNVLRRKFPGGCYSYLDAHSLNMFINQGDGRTQKLPAGRAVEVSLTELLTLHDYEFKDPAPRQTPRQPELCRAIMEVHRTTAGFKQWRQWLSQLGGNNPQLPTAAEYPALASVIQSFSALHNEQTSAERAVAQALGFPELKKCSKFFLGEWLEEYTLDALDQCSGDLGIQDQGVSVSSQKKTGQRDFELDVAAMVGYQLFAISCIATDQVDKAKEHLLEVYVRARQIGGDEARFGLVCRVKTPSVLQKEIEQDWEDAEGKIQVFGQRDLPRLDGCLRDWIRKASKEA